MTRFLAATLILALTLTGAAPAFARTHRHHAGHVTHTAYHPPGTSYLLMDADTGTILAQSNPDLQLHPASLTKTMTLLLTFEALQRGDLRLGDAVPISNHAASMSPSKLDLPAGSSIRVQDAIYAVVTHSANDIAVALAEKLGGTEGRFSIVMNRRAEQLGMHHTHFVNASGLHDPMQISSARDMALLARYLVVGMPQYYRYFATRDFTYRGYVYHNHNHLMDTYAGMDGLKTGFIQQSGFNLISSAKRNGYRLIGVVFGGRTTNARNIQMAGLLNQGFARMAHVSLAAATSASQIMPAAGTPAAAEDEMNPELQKGTLGRMIGQGDIDPAVSSRFETGLQAISAVRQQGGGQQASLPADEDSWAIQIGAGSSRNSVDEMLSSAQAKLPPSFSRGEPVIVPLKTAQGWIFRGRLSGYSKSEAVAACKLLKDCVPVSPQAY